MKSGEFKDVKSKLVAIRISRGLHDKLRELAARDRRTFSAYVRLALLDHCLGKLKEQK